MEGDGGGSRFSRGMDCHGRDGEKGGSKEVRDFRLAVGFRRDEGPQGRSGGFEHGNDNTSFRGDSFIGIGGNGIRGFSGGGDSSRFRGIDTERGGSIVAIGGKDPFRGISGVDGAGTFRGIGGGGSTTCTCGAGGGSSRFRAVDPGHGGSIVRIGSNDTFRGVIGGGTSFSVNAGQGSYFRGIGDDGTFHGISGVDGASTFCSIGGSGSTTCTRGAGGSTTFRGISTVGGGFEQGVEINRGGVDTTCTGDDGFSDVSDSSWGSGSSWRFRGAGSSWGIRSGSTSWSSGTGGTSCIGNHRAKSWTNTRWDGHRWDGSCCKRRQNLKRGRETGAGTWWDVTSGRIVVEGVDFAQDTQEGGADEYIFIPDEELVEAKHSFDNIEFAPDTEEQDVPVVDDNEFVPETEMQDVDIMHKNGADSPNRLAEPCNKNGGDSPKQEGNMDNEDVKPIHFDDSREEEYEPMDDFQFEMVRLMLPGFTQTFQKYRK